MDERYKIKGEKVFFSVYIIFYENLTPEALLSYHQNIKRVMDTRNKQELSRYYLVKIDQDLPWYIG